MDTILALCNEKTLRKLRPRLKKVQLDLKAVAKRSTLPKRLKETHPDLVLIDIAMPMVPGLETSIQLVRERAPTVPILITDVASCDVESLRRLVNQAAGEGHAGRPGEPPAELFHPNSGRIDAGRIAKFFDLPLARLARILGHSAQAVHKTPDAESLQDQLTVFVRIASVLLSLFGSAHKARIWLNAPNPDLDKLRPKELLERGKPEIIAELLEDAVLGHPG